MFQRVGVLWLCLNLAWLAAAGIQEIQVDGKICWRLSTALMEAVISPEDGGRVIELLDKTSGEPLTRAASAVQAPAGSGLFADRVWPKGRGVIRTYETSAYTVVSSRADAESAEIVLRREIAPLTVEKRIVLQEKERCIRADYALSNPQVESFAGTFWSCNVLVPPTKETYRMYLPTGMLTDQMKGTAAVTDNQVSYTIGQPASANHFVNAPEHDYAAVLGDRTGAALLMPFACLERFYSCHPALTTQSLRVPTLEWFSLPFFLPSYAEGVAQAGNRPELADPLQDYVYRFTVAVEAFAAVDFDPAVYRPKSTEAKLERFVPPAEDIPVYTDFQRGALCWAANAEPISLLAVVNAKASAEMFEFARRFPLALTVVEVDHPHVFGPHRYFSWVVPDPGERLLQQLTKEPQVILLSGTFETAMPEEARRQLLARVEAGTPLIYISHDNRFPTLLSGTPTLPVPPEIFAGVPFTGLPIEAPAIELHQYGAGTVYWVKYRLINSNLRWTQDTALTPFEQHDNGGETPFWEYSFAFYGRLLRHAAGRTPSLRLAEMQAAEELALTLQAARDGQAAVKVRLDGPGQIGLAELQWQGRVISGENRVSLPLPVASMVRNGDYYCNVRVELDGRGEDWGAVVKTVNGPCGLVRLNLDRYAHRGANPEITGEVEIRGSADLQLQLSDIYGRVLAQEDRPGVAGQQRFTLVPVSRHFLPLAELVATLTVDGVEIDRRRATLTLEPPPAAPLNFVIWTHGSNAWFNRDFERSLAEIGFTVATGSHVGILDADLVRAQAEDVMRAGLRYAPMSMHRIGVPAGKLSGVERDPCLRDPTYWQKMYEDVKATVEKTKDSFPFTYYSGDENSLGHYDAAHDFCQSPYCLQAFQAAMQGKYGDLSVLNQRWQCQYNSWDEVRPPTLAKAQAGKTMVPWVEHRIFMMQAVSDAIYKMKAELVRLDPGARLGFSGQLNTNLNGAFNWSAALASVDYPTAYLRGTDGLCDLVRSQMRLGGSSGAWIGYGAPLSEIRWNYWRQIANGWFSPSYWWSGYFVRHGDQRLSHEGEHLRDVLAEIRSSGVDLILAGSRPEHSPFTLVYSIPSLVISAVTGQTSVFNPSNYTANFNGWSALIRDLGYQPPQVITCAELATADLSGHQILVLPMTQMLDDSAVDALVHYVEGGGTLVIDGQAGFYDGFAMPRSANRLATLAGVRFEPATSSEATGSMLFGENYLRLMLTGSRVVLDGGTALAGIGVQARTVEFGGMKVTSPAQGERQPALVWRRQERGRAVYLNGLLADYPGIRSQPASGRPVREGMQALLTAVRPDLAPAHQLPADCDVLAYNGHGNRYLAVVRHTSDDPSEAVLALGKAAHVYDTMAHKYLGEFATLALDLPPYAVRTLALLPAKMAPMQGAVEWDGRKFRIGLSRADRSPGGAVRLEVWCEGRLRSCYAGNYLLSERLDLEVDPGLIPEAGVWRVRVTDLFDGTVVERELRLPAGGQ